MENTFGFSKREMEVVELLLEGKSNKQIAITLDISIGTVEFHLSRIYAKLGVRSRAEAIVLLNHLRKTPDLVVRDKTGEKSRPANSNFGESQVEKDISNGDNKSERNSLSQEAPDISAKPVSFFGKYRMYIAALIVILILVAVIAVFFYLSAPTPWKDYARECEYPDEFTFGQTIGRSNASASSTHGQFGTTSSEPWSALPGFLTYKNINTPHVEQLYMKLRYSKNSLSSVPILIYIDDETNPRAAFYLADQGDWNRFAWTDPIFLGTIENGIHSVRFTTEGQQYGVADLDKFVLTEGRPK